MSELIRYLKLNKIVPLKKEELNIYYDEILAGNTKKRDEFIARSVYLIRYIMKKHLYYYPEQVDDLISLGLEIVIKVLGKLNHETRETFTSYLCINIKYNLMNYLKKHYKYQNKLFYINNYIEEDEKNTFDFFLEDKKIDINKYVSKLDFENAINQMTDLEMKIVIEFCLDNLSITEIAQKHKMKKSNISFIKECALKKLAYMLSDYVSRENDQNFNDWSTIVDNL